MSWWRLKTSYEPFDCGLWFTKMIKSLALQVGPMARPGRPLSESYKSVCAVSLSSETATIGPEDEDDQAPIFSLSKSSMDVVMATGPPHKRDPAWTPMDLRRSSSTITPSENNTVMLKQLHPHIWQHMNATNSHQLSLTAQNVDVHSPPILSERWIANMQRWSQCSSSTHSRSSTPDTIVGRDEIQRPSSLIQETPFSVAPDSPSSKPSSPLAKASSFTSPLQTPNLPPQDLLTSSSSLLMLNPTQQKDLLVSSPTSSPLLSPQQAYASSPLPSNSPNLLQLTSTEDEGFLENNSLSFIFPSPIPSSVSLAEGGASSDPGCLADDATEELQSFEGIQFLEGEELRSPVEILSYLMPNSPAKEKESVASVCYNEVPWQPGQSCLPGRNWKSPLVASMSDSQLGDCCRCKFTTRESITKAPAVEVFREEGTMTSQPELVDAAVQTLSPMGSLWGLRRNISTTDLGSHSLLGSPPGSKLNLKSSVGSNSNLVSPSSSMFPASSGEEEEEKRADDQTENLLHDPERRRSCLKVQSEEKDELGRRSSMKQVQWDEDGMTWDVHGASLDPEVLSTAIQKHLEVQSSPQPVKRASKKKKAPKPPIISNVVKAMVPELSAPVAITKSPSKVKAQSEETPEGEVEREEKEGGKKEETNEPVRRISRAEGASAKEDDEVYGEEGTSSPRPLSRGNKKSVIRSLRRPAWCGGSRKPDI